MTENDRPSGQRGDDHLEVDRQARADVKRQRIVGATVAAGLVIATIAAVVFGTKSDDGSVSADTQGAFGTHYSGLEERRLQAGVATMTDSASGGPHIHPELSVYVRGEQIPIPVNIGIDPSQPPETMAGLHTHDSSGVIHIENAAEPTLGQFFDVWGVPFGADRLGPYEARGDDTVRMWVDGEPSEQFGDLVLEDGQQVVIAFGTKTELPPGFDG